MACCAFAVFLLSQLLLPFTRLRGLLFGAPAPTPDDAAGWTPGMAASPPSRPRTFIKMKRALAVAACLELALMSGVVLGGMSLPAFSSDTAQSGMLADIETIHTTICGVFGLTY
ncbi:MAG: hypothetical protein K9G30_08535 [Parvibaculum sp.]|nr:hypothetical protein [Parvibaculum sp.]